MTNRTSDALELRGLIEKERRHRVGSAYGETEKWTDEDQRRLVCAAERVLRAAAGTPEGKPTPYRKIGESMGLSGNLVVTGSNAPPTPATDARTPDPLTPEDWDALTTEQKRQLFDQLEAAIAALSLPPAQAAPDEGTALEQVLKHLQTLDWLPAPQVLMESDGEIGLDFDLERGQLSFNVSERTREMGWAAVCDGYRGHGRFSLSAHSTWSPELNHALAALRQSPTTGQE